MRFLFVVLLITALIKPQIVRASMFGEENIALVKLVAGQIVELEKLADAVNAAEDQRKILADVNAGVSRTINQIESIEEIIIRTKGLDPKNTRRVSDITGFLNETRDLKRRAEEILTIKLNIAEHAVTQSALQSETAYSMGQEMVGVGSTLAQESRTASPGRASQIQAAAMSASMLSQGVQLQTLAHLTQLQAMTLELQRTKMAQEVLTQNAQNEMFLHSLNTKRKL